MTPNPFDIIKAEEFNHGLHELASLMHFGAARAESLLTSSNAFLDGSRGSGKSLYEGGDEGTTNKVNEEPIRVSGQLREL